MHKKQRNVENYAIVNISDDFGNFMTIGDQVEIHVMPYDYKVIGVLIFDIEKCSFVILTDISVHDLSHSTVDNDMQSTIKITKSFRLISEGEQDV